MMLQQTQVTTVLPFYRRFLRRFPTWRALARAPEDRVLKAWEGLGYYRRARHLQAAARLVVGAFRGALPDTPGALQLLPGVGKYSAGAILSIAFGKPLALVDGNVIRVCARIRRMGGDLKSGSGNRKVWEWARQVLDPRHPGDFNQALMELGATVCTPVAPECGRCPVASLCAAYRQGDPERYPRGSGAKKIVRVFAATAWCRKGGRVLIRKRPPEGRWLGGLWEFPSAEAATLKEARKRLTSATGIRLEKRPLMTIRHQITHHRIHRVLYRGVAGPNTLGRWVSGRELGSYPFSSAHSRLRAQLRIS